MATNKTQAFSGCDYIEISTGLFYCKQKNLYWKNGTAYCPLSATHNGLIGGGAQLKQIIKEEY